MKPATLSLFPLAALALLCTGAAWPPSRPPSVLAASGLPDNSYLIVIGAIVLIAGGALGGLVNLLKVVEHFRLKRQGELAGNNSGLVSRHTLDEELNRVYVRIEERDKRLEDKIDNQNTTLTTLASNMASASTAIHYLAEQVKDSKGKGAARG